MPAFILITSTYILILICFNSEWIFNSPFVNARFSPLDSRLSAKQDKCVRLMQESIEYLRLRAELLMGVHDAVSGDAAAVPYLELA